VISIGQVAAAQLSAQVLGLSQIDVERIRRLFERAGLPTEVKLNRSQLLKLMAAMSLDKKVAAGEIKFVLARKIGEVKFGVTVPAGLLQKLLASTLAPPSIHKSTTPPIQFDHVRR